MKKLTSKNVIELFKNGETNAVSGTKSNPGNVKISGDKLIHYWTPILERYENGYLLNMTRYSVQTGRLQNYIRELIPVELLKVVSRVPSDYKGSLSDFLD